MSLLNTNTWVNDCYPDEFAFLFGNDQYLSISIGELQCIWHEVQNNLLKSLLVSFDHMTFKADVSNIYSDVFHHRLVLKNMIYFIDSIWDAEVTAVFDEILAVFVQDSIIKDIMNEKVNELTGRLHLEAAVIESYVDGL